MSKGSKGAGDDTINPKACRLSGIVAKKYERPSVTLAHFRPVPVGVVQEPKQYHGRASLVRLSTFPPAIIRHFSAL